MKSLFRSVCAKLMFYGRSVNIIPECQPRRLLPRCAVVYGVEGSSHLSSVAGGENSPPSLKIQAWLDEFEDINLQVQKPEGLRMTIHLISLEIGSAARCLQVPLRAASYIRSITDVLEEAKEHIPLLREHYNKLAEIIQECPRHHHRYHGEWSEQTQTVVSLLVFINWLETGRLLLLTEVEKKLGLNSSKFGIDSEDYLAGLSTVTKEFAVYVRNRAYSGDSDSPRKALEFLRKLHMSYLELNLVDDFLDEKYEGMLEDIAYIEKRIRVLEVLKTAQPRLPFY